MKNADDPLKHFASSGVPFWAKRLDVLHEFLKHRFAFWSEVQREVSASLHDSVHP
jgi:hypothetical protein